MAWAFLRSGTEFDTLPTDIQRHNKLNTLIRLTSLTSAHGDDSDCFTGAVRRVQRSTVLEHTYPPFHELDYPHKSERRATIAYNPTYTLPWRLNLRAQLSTTYMTV
eukprot:scaffold241154_cov19-Prasinocladus_malaysianus.AAC.1